MEKKTNNFFLKKGLSKLLWSIPFFFSGPIFLFQSFKNIKHDFCIKYLNMTETEYLEALNKATNGGLVKEALWN